MISIKRPNQTKDIRWLTAHYPKAFEALPEVYRADNCLDFWEEEQVLWCAPKQDQEEILGQWKACFIGGDWSIEEFVEEEELAIDWMIGT